MMAFEGNPTSWSNSDWPDYIANYDYYLNKTRTNSQRKLSLDDAIYVLYTRLANAFKTITSLSLCYPAVYTCRFHSNIADVIMVTRAIVQWNVGNAPEIKNIKTIEHIFTRCVSLCLECRLRYFLNGANSFETKTTCTHKKMNDWQYWPIDSTLQMASLFCIYQTIQPFQIYTYIILSDKWSVIVFNGAVCLSYHNTNAVKRYVNFEGKGVGELKIGQLC